MKPLCIDLFCGLGGWAEGFLAEGWRVVGFDIERHRYAVPEFNGDSDGTKGTKPVEKRGWTQGCAVSLGLEGATAQPRTRMLEYPGQLVLQNVLTLHGSQFRNAACIVASPPCTEYSFMAMPWRRAKQIAVALRGLGDFPEKYTGSRTLAELNALFNACLRIQREAIAATARNCPACGGKGFMVWYVGETHPCERCEGQGYITRYIPLVVENVKGAQPWVGQAKARFGSYFLWGDVASVGGRIVAGRVGFNAPMLKAAARGGRVPGLNFHEHEKTGKPGRSFQSAAVEATKNTGGSWFNVAHNTESGTGQNPVNGRKGEGGGWFRDQLPDGSRPHWKESACITRHFNSKSPARKAASVMIAKIPYDLACHIARCFHPDRMAGVA